MNSTEFMYQPTDLEEELFLSEVPYELIEQSLKTQFDDPFEYRKKDYIQSFILKYNFSKDNLLEDDMIMLEVYRDKFLSFIEKLFMDYLGVSFPELEDMDEEDAHDLIQLSYRFFIKNIKKNFVNMIYNYINQNEEKISSSFSKKRDVTSINFKSELDDEYDILVLSNLSDIILEIINEIKLNADVDE